MVNAKQTFVYKEGEGYALALDIYLPRNTFGDLPVVLFLHGGALIFGGRDDASHEEIEAILQAGIAYVSADYRLSPETRLMEIIQDVRDVLTWIRKEGARLFRFDPQRIAVMGKSAGGYLALSSGMYQQRPKAIISFYGYGDILGDWYSKPSPHYTKSAAVTKQEADACISKGILTRATFPERWPIYLRARQTGTWAQLVSGLHRSELSDALAPYCPIQNIDSNYPPTFLLHGTEDTDVPFVQSEEMHAALSVAGAEVRFYTAHGEEHGFDAAWKNTPDEYGRVVRFLKEVL